jgi:hypothetical protein
LYASHMERMENRSSDIQEHDSGRVDPYAVSRGRDALVDNANSDPVLPSAYHSTPLSGPSSSRGRGMLRTLVYKLRPPDQYLIESIAEIVILGSLFTSSGAWTLW